MQKHNSVFIVFDSENNLNAVSLKSKIFFFDYFSLYNLEFN